MSKRLKKYAPTLRYLANCDKRTAKSIIKKAKPELIDCFSDICHNVLIGNVKLSPAEKKRLAKHKKHIRKIANKKTTQKHKKALIQRGGFLASLLAPLIGTVLSLFTGKS